MKVPALQGHDIFAFVGKRGSGKSTRAKKFCGELMKARRRVLVFDPHDEYSQKGRKSQQVTLGPLRERVTVRELLRNVNLLDDPKLSLAVVPTDGSYKGIGADFVLVSEFVKLSESSLVFVADELGSWGAHCCDVLDYLATQSRHFCDDGGVPLVWIAQRMIQIPKTARTQITILDSGIQTDPEDLEAIRKLTQDKEFAARVSRLGQGDSLTWRDKQGK